MNAETLELVQDWAKRTEEILKAQFAKHNITKEDLHRSVRMEVYKRSSALIGVNLWFLTYGRFVDMGVGRKSKQSLEGSRKLKQRKPKKWYSRPFYGRLNSLNSIVMATVAEEAIQSIINPLKQ